MNPNTTRRTLCALALFAATTGAALAAPPAPGDSIYQLDVPLTDQDGRPLALDAHRGQPILVSMFYTSCKFVCPMLVDTIRDTTMALSEAERARLNVLIVSFDPAKDSVPVLKKAAEQRSIDARRWALARTDAAHTRKLAAVLGIQYRAVGNGDFNHTTALILLDSEGRIAGRSTRLGKADAAFVKLVRQALKQAAPN